MQEEQVKQVFFRTTIEENDLETIEKAACNGSTYVDVTSAQSVRKHALFQNALHVHVWCGGQRPCWLLLCDRALRDCKAATSDHLTFLICKGVRGVGIQVTDYFMRAIVWLSRASSRKLSIPSTAVV